MCHKIFQTYDCGHLKEICTSPCPHALATGTPAPPQIRVSSSDALPQAPATDPRPVTPASVGHTPSPRERPLPATPPPVYEPEPESERTPNLCGYFFQRYLRPSAYPCLQCYMQPRYAVLRGRWLDEYRAGHPGHNLERIEELAGVEGVADRVGLVNVMREMERLRMEMGARQEG